MRTRIDRDEWIGWLAFAALYPFGPERLSVEAAYSRMYAAIPYSRAGASLDFEDFSIDYKADRSDEANMERVKAWFLAHTTEVDSGGVDRQRGANPGDEGRGP